MSERLVCACGNTYPKRRGSGAQRSRCPECRAALPSGDAMNQALNDGHGKLLNLNPETAAYVLSMRQTLDRERAEGEEAVAIAMSLGVTDACRRHERPCFAQEIDALVAAADRAWEEAGDARRYSLSQQVELARLRDSNPRGCPRVYGRDRAARPRGAAVPITAALQDLWAREER